MSSWWMRKEARVARSLGSHAGSPTLWEAASTSSLEQATQEMEGCSQEGPTEDWYYG